MNQRKLEFCSHAGNLALLRSYVRQFLGGKQFNDQEIELMVLGLDEACTNIIRHAYKNQDDQPITLTIEMMENGVRFRLRDFAEHTQSPRFSGRTLDHVQPGGLGIHLIRSSFDKVNYRRRPNGTELVLVKFFPAPPSSSAMEVAATA